jgi:hypothetical protein
MKKIITIGLSIFLLTGIFLFAADAERCMQSIDFSNLFKIVKYLASDELQGRLSGHEGFNKAAEWAAGKFKEWGIKPVYSDYYRRFNVDYNDIGENYISLLLPGKDNTEIIKSLKLMKEYIPELYTGFGEAEAPVVFAGYGITAPQLGWDDYGELDVKGKIVLVLAGYPPLPGKNFSTYWEDGRHKSVNAKSRGALALIRISFSSLGGVVGDRYVEGLPMIRISENVARFFFSNSGISLKAIKEKLDKGQNITFDTGIRAKLKVNGVHHPVAETFDVVGMIEGSDPVLKNEYVLVGAHLDHVGCTPVLFPGADDNASGVAVVMGIAHAFSMLEEPPKRSVAFILFAAEERGGGGDKSSILNEMPKYPSNLLWMVNFDMVGVGDTAAVAGADVDPELFSIMEKVIKQYSIRLNITAVKNEGMMSRSDHTSFQRRHIPSYGNWTNGEDNGYHTDKDTIYKITPQIMEDLARAYFMAIYRFLEK